MCLSLYICAHMYVSLSHFVGKREQTGSKFNLRHRLTPCPSPIHESLHLSSSDIPPNLFNVVTSRTY